MTKRNKNKAEKASESMLALLHAGIAENFLAKLAAGEMTPQDMTAAIKFLKDNNITAVIEKNNDLDQVADGVFKTEFDD